MTDDSNLFKNNYYYALTSESVPTPTPKILPHHTGIADSGASGFYFALDAPVTNYNPQAPAVGVRVANGRPERRWLAPLLHQHHHSLKQQCWDMSCLPSRIPSSAWGHLLTKVAKSSLPRQQSQSTTPMVIPFSQAGGMRVDHVYGTFLSLRRPRTPQERRAPQRGQGLHHAPPVTPQPHGQDPHHHQPDPV